MSKLEKEMGKALKEINSGFPTISWNGVYIKDMTRNELEYLCILLGHQCLSEKRVIEVSLK